MSEVVSVFNQKSLPESPVKNRKRSRLNFNIVFFALNVAMVIFSYGLANLTDKASLTPMKLARIVLLAVSLFYLMFSKKEYQYIFKGKSSWVVWIFIVINFYVLPFSINFSLSLEKFINLVPYFIYINYFIIYLYRIYDKQYILNSILILLNIIYFLPVISFLFFGGGFEYDDIYGETVGGFVSNHYGWSSVIFLTTSVDIIRNKASISIIKRVVLISCCLLAVYILSISGSRSAYLSFALCFILFILKNKNASLAIKILSVIAALSFVLHLYSDSDSALNKRLAKTETQLEKGDARTAIYDLGFSTMVNNPFTVITGFGFYAPTEAMLELNENVDKKVLEVLTLHNSYLELLFGSGLLIFVFFFLTFIGKTLWNFGLSHAAHYTFLPPIILIPFFENNFNPGQFLFFPWFAIMFYYIHYNERQIKIDTIKQDALLIKKHQFL